MLRAWRRRLEHEASEGPGSGRRVSETRSEKRTRMEELGLDEEELEGLGTLFE